MKPVRIAARLVALAFVSLVAWAGAPAVAQRATALVTLPGGSTDSAAVQRAAAAWRDAGPASQVIWLDAVAQKEPGFASLGIVEFASEPEYLRWRQQSASKLPAGSRVRRVDAVVSGVDPAYDPRPAVFEVNVYRLTTSVDRYREFSEGYIVPLMEGQRTARLMHAYTMYVERAEGAGDPANSILVKAYVDDKAYAAAPEAKLALRAQLTEKHPTYPKFHAIKETLRQNVSETVAKWASPVPARVPAM